MKLFFFLFNFWCLLFITSACFAQGRDAIWHFGDSTGINFNGGSAVVISNNNSYCEEAGSSICDDQGALLFYCGFDWQNNFYIWNKNNQVMQNSNLIVQNGTITFTQGILICTMPDDSNKYYLFMESSYSGTDNLNYHIIDMSQDSGRGAVINANLNLCMNCLLSEKMVVIRHANGRDWWLLYAVMPNFTTGANGYFITNLISPTGISNPVNQFIGPGKDNIGQISISPTGNKIFVADLSRGLNLYDFDRCTGSLSNWIELGYPPYLNSAVFDGFYGSSFSPSGRFIYASRLDSVFQYDIQAPDILASRVFLAKTGNVNHYWLGQHKLGLDGKIYFPNLDWDYLGTLDLDKFLNVINYPDSEGLACGLALYSFNLFDRKALLGMPNIPNYNLGPVTGSVCDSLAGLQEIKKENVTLFPNPANYELTIVANDFKSSFDFSLFDLQGCLAFKQDNIKQKEVILNISALHQGIYFYSILQMDTKRCIRGKLCIMH